MASEQRYHTGSSGYEMEPVFIANSPSMQELSRQLNKIAVTEATVLLTGESGTGKEIVSRLIHHKSDRNQKPFLAVNCGAIPKDLIESELFGHEQGAFTGASNLKKGCFELADGGTLFLDEIGEMEPEMQVKLLRAVEYKAFRRIGGREEIETDVRIIAATNRDMSKAIEKGEFRKDLFYRLSIIELHIPPLRKRRDDVPPLVKHFEKLFSAKYKCGEKKMSEECMHLLKEYNWPGNVRELRNTIERCVIMCPDEIVGPEYLTNDISGLSCSENDDRDEEADVTSISSPMNGSNGYNRTEVNGNQEIKQVHIPVGATAQEAEKMLIDKTLSYVSNNKSEAARILGFSRQTLHNKLNKYSE